MSRYPFGLHGYHRPSGKTGKVSFLDPLNVFGSTYVPGEKEAKEGAAAAEAEEARKTALRNRINALYGIDAPGEAPIPEPGGGGKFKIGQIVSGQNEQITARNQAASSESAAARSALEAENTKLADATRSYYTDQLGRSSQKAERNTRFKLARQSLLGGSEDVFQQGEVSSDRDLGATRVDDAVRRAIAQLTGSREQERLNAIGLVNSGQGDSAVSAAQAGLRSSLENVSSAQKADLFGDLFSGGADAVTANNIAGNEALLAARFRDRLGSFFPARSTTSGRVTPSA